jgi:hypothetical protein
LPSPVGWTDKCHTNAVGKREDEGYTRGREQRRHLQPGQLAEETLVVKRHDKLTLQLQSTPHLINAHIVLDHLKDCTQLTAQATPEEEV